MAIPTPPSSSQVDGKPAASANLGDDKVLLKAMIDNSGDIMCLLDNQGRIAYLNSAITQLTGYEPEELNGTEVIDWIHPEDQANSLEQLTALLAGSIQTVKRIFRFQKKNGGWIELEGVGRPFHAGGIDGAIFNSRDITAQQEALRSLDLSNDVLLKTFNATQIMLTISHMETGELIRVNPEWLKSFGFEEHEVLGRTSIELNTWGSRENRDRIVGKLRTDGYLRDYEILTYDRAGKERETVISAEIIDIQGEPHVLFIARDITAANQMERQLRQAQKMEAVGQLTGGVAHDFNNLLSVVQGGIEMLAELTNDNETAMQIVESVQHSIDRGAAMTHQLLAFSRRQHLRPEIISLDDFLETLLPLLKTTVGDNVSIKLVYDDNACQCLVDPVQFETAILNLVINARDAMNSGGSLTISVQNTSISKDSDALKAGEYVEVLIEDTGKRHEPRSIESGLRTLFYYERRRQGNRAWAKHGIWFPTPV